MLQSWDEHRENHGALMRLLDREPRLPAWVEMRRWHRRSWWLLAAVLLMFLWLLLLAKT